MHIRPVRPSDFDELGSLTVDAYRPFGVVDDEGLGFVRDPKNDWEPDPGVELLGYRLDLSRG